MNLLKLVVSASFVLTSSQAFAYGSILVSEPYLDGIYETYVFNGSSYAITKITFDFTTTFHGRYITADGAPFSITAPEGGTATFFTDGGKFGFTFTSFDPFDKFKFHWNPISLADPSYEVYSGDFVNGLVHAVVEPGYDYVGRFSHVSFTHDLAASLVATLLPEPSTYASLGLGLALLGFAARRKAI